MVHRQADPDEHVAPTQHRSIAIECIEFSAVPRAMSRHDMHPMGCTEACKEGLRHRLEEVWQPDELPRLPDQHADPELAGGVLAVGQLAGRHRGISINRSHFTSLLRI